MEYIPMSWSASSPPLLKLIAIPVGVALFLVVQDGLPGTLVKAYLYRDVLCATLDAAAMH